MAAIRATHERALSAKAHALESAALLALAEPPTPQARKSSSIAGVPVPPVVRIFIADTHEIFRIGIVSALKKHLNWKIVGKAGSSREICAMATLTAPDIIIVDCSLPGAIETIRKIHSAFSKIEILALAACSSDELTKNVLQAGARALVLKSDGKKHLLDAIECLAAHKPYPVSKSSEPSLDPDSIIPRSAPNALSACERMVVQLIAEGYSNKETSEILHRSQKTIETHRASAMRKLNLDSTAALVRYAVRTGIVEP